MSSRSIDIVYTWVDVSDDRWNKKKQSYYSSRDNLTKNGLAESRFIDTQELKYSIRSVRQYLPWVRNIYIITDNQRPDWLSRDSDVKIIDHVDIIPKSLLPTFNSNLIEWHIHRIKGIADNFIYMCDDFLVGSDLQPDDFFTEDNKVIYRCFDPYGPDGDYSRQSIREIINSRTEDNSTLGLPHFDSSFEIIEQEVSQKIERFFLKHAPIPFQKNHLEAMYERYRPYIKDMDKFRSTKDISSQYMVAAKNVSTGAAVVDISQESVFEWVTNKGYKQAPIELLNMFSPSCKFISIATGDTFDKNRVAVAQDMLKIKYPIAGIDEFNSGSHEEITTCRLNSILHESSAMAQQPIETGIMYNETNTKERSFVFYKIRKISTLAKNILKQNSTKNEDPHVIKKELILRSGVFDRESYLRQNPDVASSGVDPFEHFIHFGIYEGRNPSDSFDMKFYIQKNSITSQDFRDMLAEYVQGDDYRSGVLEYTLQDRKEYERDVVAKIVSRAESRPIVSMVSMEWDTKLKQRPHHLASRLSEIGATVLYIDSGMVDTVSREVSKNLFVLSENTYERLILELPHMYFWLFSTTTCYTIGDFVAMQKEGVEFIYDYIDDMDEAISEEVAVQREIYDNLGKINPKILVASAQVLHEQLSDKFPNREIVMAKNAVNIEDFDIDKARTVNDAPEDLRQVLATKKPIVGYYGAMAGWLDYDLINTITAKRDDLEFVFIGVDYQGALKNLEIRENVHFLGPKQYEELPEYSYWFDCATIPFQKGDIAQSTSPVKLFEYMAMGIPTVCTKDLKECYGYEYVYISDGSREFNSNIDKAIKSKKDAKRVLRAQAMENTWRSRAEAVFAHLQ